VVAEESRCGVNEEIVMPKQKDLKRIVRSRMQKTGESYTAARANVVKRTDVKRTDTKPEPKSEPLDLSAAGLSEERVRNATGRGWTEWVALLDAADGRNAPHATLVRHVSSFGTPDWWSQMVVVGYERIRGLRQHGQRMDQTWEVSRSRTFNVPLETLFEAVANAKQRAKWFDGLTITRTASTKNKSVRLKFDDGTGVDIRFTVKDGGKTILGLGHTKLPSKDVADRMKRFWSERLDRLKALVA
jgi:uncharacterized protein YndB with AHSA1/START domain